jgi:hypothetical protein
MKRTGKEAGVTRIEIQSSIYRQEMRKTMKPSFRVTGGVGQNRTWYFVVTSQVGYRDPRSSVRIYAFVIFIVVFSRSKEVP